MRSTSYNCNKKKTEVDERVNNINLLGIKCYQGEHLANLLEKIEEKGVFMKDCFLNKRGGACFEVSSVNLI